MGYPNIAPSSTSIFTQCELKEPSYVSMFDAMADLREHNERLQKLVEQRTAERDDADKRYEALLGPYEQQRKTIEDYQSTAHGYVQFKMEISELKAENAEHAKTIEHLKQALGIMRQSRDQAIKQRLEMEDRVNALGAAWRELKQQLDTALSYQAITNDLNNRVFFRQSRENERLSTRLMHARALIKHQSEQLQRESECSASWRIQTKLNDLWRAGYTSTRNTSAQRDEAIKRAKDWAIAASANISNILYELVDAAPEVR